MNKLLDQSENKEEKVTKWDYKRFLINNSVTIVFVIVCMLGIYFSKLLPVFIVNELVNRVTRNLFIVLSLIIPILAGMGLNFGITIGAMAAQIGIFTVLCLKLQGISGFLIAAVITTPLAILFGYLIGLVLNKCKGREMITGMILAFFAEGLYQLLFLYIIGGVIPVKNATFILGNGIGVKNSIDLTGNIKYALDNLFGWKLELPLFLIAAGVLGIVFLILKPIIVRRRSDGKNSAAGFDYGSVIFYAVLSLLGACSYFGFDSMRIVKVPIATCFVVALLYVGNYLLMKSKLGQDFRAIGQSLPIARSAGINVDRTRIIAIVISTVLAAWGQLIFLQNIGTINTYGSHSQVGLFACAALLIGGASVTKANGKQALLGVILFHTLFIVAPIAGKNIFGEPQIGEFFRVFVAYGVIGVSLALYAWQKNIKNSLKYISKNSK